MDQVIHCSFYYACGLGKISGHCWGGVGNSRVMLPQGISLSRGVQYFAMISRCTKSSTETSWQKSATTVRMPSELSTSTFDWKTSQETLSAVNSTGKQTQARSVVTSWPVSYWHNNSFGVTEVLKNWTRTTAVLDNTKRPMVSLTREIFFQPHMLQKLV